MNPRIAARFDALRMAGRTALVPYITAGFPQPSAMPAILRASVRGGADNTEILTTYSGTVPGSAMKAIIPSSSGDSFDVEWQVTDDGELREATLTGVFYPHAEEMTYTVDFADYGTEKDIAAP